MRHTLFHVLVHPRAVSTFQWRPVDCVDQADYPSNTCTPQTLASISNGVIFLWQESDPSLESLDMLLVRKIQQNKPFVGVSFLHLHRTTEAYSFRAQLDGPTKLNSTQHTLCWMEQLGIS